MSNCLKEKYNGACCCNCSNHIEDFHHCTTKKDKVSNECVCSEHKGWICFLPPLDDKGVGRAYSGWSEHGMCELHNFKNNG